MAAKGQDQFFYVKRREKSIVSEYLTNLKIVWQNGHWATLTTLTV